MSIEDREEKEKRIKSEVVRLTKIYAEVPQKKRLTIKGLIQRAAFMRVSLDFLEEDLNIYGFTEMFSQGDQDPYDRKRPNADVYNSMNTSYQKIIKQLTDLLPREGAEQKVDDGFDAFIINRED
ncbi:MAG: hypothetical protein RSB05_05750 [Clostridiales bacterium]